VINTPSKAVLAVLLTVLASGAALWQTLGTAAPTSAPREHDMQRTELYFGAIDEAKWDEFLEQEVTPRFPDGLSWYDVHGQWRGPSGKPEKLPSRILLLIHADNPANSQALAEIGELFRQRYGMAVLKVSDSVKASDPDWTEVRVEGNQQLAPKP